MFALTVSIQTLSATCFMEPRSRQDTGWSTAGPPAGRRVAQTTTPSSPRSASPCGESRAGPAAFRHDVLLRTRLTRYAFADPRPQPRAQEETREQQAGQERGGPDGRSAGDP